MFIDSAILFLNTATLRGIAFTADTVFYLNLVLAFCAAIALTTAVVLFKKTRCARRVCIAVISVLAVGLAVFAVQLVLFAMRVGGAEYAVYVCFGVLCAAFILDGVYCGLLMRNSHKALCLISAITCLFPPLGVLAVILLSYKIKRDTKVKKLVFGGYAYTYAALCAFADDNKAELIDPTDDAAPEKLDKKQVRLKLKQLKKDATTAEGMFAYAAAIISYTPEDRNVALRLIRKSAEKGYAPALFNLGYYYETGTFVKRDEKKAVEFYKKAKDNGDADAEFRLIMMVLKNGGDGANAISALTERAESGDMYAKYNLGVCRERALGCDADIDAALALYVECANADFLPAERRIFSLAINEMNAPSVDGLFERLTRRAYKPAEFAVMIKGLIDIKNRLAADASDKFLLAAKLRGRWEGVARCLVGTLYIDRGKLREDRHNGAEYVKSALGLWKGAAAVYEIIPKTKAGSPKPPKAKRAGNKSGEESADNITVAGADGE